MDPIHIIQVSVLSKILNEPANLFSNPYILICLIVVVSMRMIPYSIHLSIENRLIAWFFNENESSITIPYHIKSYNNYGSVKPVEKVLFSNRFHAINYHIKKYHLNKLHSLNEIINFENTKYLECMSDFILVPKDNQKFLIEDKEEIYLEIILDKNKENSENGNGKTTEMTTHAKKYMYKLSKRGKTAIESINRFLEKIEKEYVNEILNKTEQTVFEYKKSMKDDDCDNQTLVFSDTPFTTNKTFDNIFFEEKARYMEFIEPFLQTSESESNEKLKSDLVRTGNIFKAIILLYGPPGCGKSSLIKATIKNSGRHCILVPWTKIKTCNDFVSLFRPIKINNRVYGQKELVIVFEDFDANDNDVIKIRKGLRNKKELANMGISRNSSHEDEGECEVKGQGQGQEDKKKKLDFFNPPIEDELTLEYVLNVLDGIVELNDSIVFFTTNDISIIDPALKRSGRINYILHMGLATRAVIREMVAYHFSVPISAMNKYAKEIKRIPEYKISYSDISEICNQTKTVEECLWKILEK